MVWEGSSVDKVDKGNRGKVALPLSTLSTYQLINPIDPRKLVAQSPATLNKHKPGPGDEFRYR